MLGLSFPKDKHAPKVPVRGIEVILIKQGSEHTHFSSYGKQSHVSWSRPPRGEGKNSDENTDASVWVSFFGFSISSFFSTKSDPALEKSKLNLWRITFW